RGALAIDAAEADAQAASQALRATQIALAADVATAYFELQTLAHRVALNRQAIAVAQRQVEVVRRKFDAGQATSVDVDRWQAELAQEQA
ncbi:TolC family protein, partial [Chromohalobacter sp. HP20-39]